MPRPRIASGTSSPMSGSTVAIGCGACSSSVTVEPAADHRLGHLHADVAAADHDRAAGLRVARPATRGSPSPSSSVCTPKTPPRVGARPVRRDRAPRRSRTRAGRSARGPRRRRLEVAARPPRAGRGRCRRPRGGCARRWRARRGTSPGRGRSARRGPCTDAADPVRDAAGRVRREVAPLERDDLQLVRAAACGPGTRPTCPPRRRR